MFYVCTRICGNIRLYTAILQGHIHTVYIYIYIDLYKYKYEYIFTDQHIATLTLTCLAAYHLYTFCACWSG